MDKLGDMRRTHYAGELREENIGDEVVLMGWVQTARSFGSLVFVDIRDVSGISQVVFDEECPEDIVEKAKKLRSEYVIGVRGKVRERSSINEDLKTGHIEILAEDLKILDRSEVPPIYVKDDDNVGENQRLKHRTLDLRKPSMQHNLILRSKLSKAVRDYLEDHRFFEVETPMLGKPTPEGARDYVVPSRVNPGKFYALPQSPQLFKQLLMVSGMDRYYQITKCFRDEDLRANRQPEFTQIDIEMSFVDVDDVLELNEGLVAHMYKELEGKEIKTPFKRMCYDEAMERFGLDKPDTRFGMELVDVSEIVKDSEFGVFSSNVKKGSSVRLINVEGQADNFSNRDIKNLETFAKDYGAMGVVHVFVEEEGIRSPISRFLSEEEIDGILEAADAEAGDLLLFIAAKDNVVFRVLGNMRVHLANKLDLIDQDQDDILWIVDFPLFEYDEEEDRYVAVHHPFTSPAEEDIDKIDTEPQNVRAKAYDLVINGDEMGGGSIRISDRDLQTKMFETLGIDSEEQEEKFGFLLEAFKYGVPPHGGIAYGLDRMAMLFAGTDNIRDVIAFPKTQQATDLMTGAPIPLDSDQLEEIHIDVVAKKTEDED